MEKTVTDLPGAINMYIAGQYPLSRRDIVKS